MKESAKGRFFGNYVDDEEDRRTDGQTDKRTGQVDMMTHKNMYRRIGGQTDRQTDGQTDRRTDRQNIKQTDRQTDKWTDGQTDRRLKCSFHKDKFVLFTLSRNITM